MDATRPEVQNSGLSQTGGSLCHTHNMKITMNKLLIAAGLLLSLTACEKAVGTHHPGRFQIEGDQTSTLYPLEVKEHSEDVIIVMKPEAPIPKIVAIDAQGAESPFNFRMEGEQITIPDKFSHISLRANGAVAVEILRKQ